MVIRDVWLSYAEKNKVHPFTLSAMRSYANILKLSKKYEEATQVFEQLFGLYKDGKIASNEVHRAQQAFGDLLNRQERYGEAIPILQEAYQSMQSRYERGNLHTIAALTTLGEAYAGQKGFTQAEACFAESVNLLAQFHPASSRLPLYRAIRANNLTDLKWFKQAEETLLSSLDSVNEKSPYRPSILGYLVRHYRVRGDETNARRFEAMR